MNMFSKFKTVNGFKRLRALTDSEYNKRSDGKDRQHNNKLNVSFSDAKRIVYDMEHMPQSEKNIEFTMIGGFDTLNALKTGINQARSSVKAVEPVREVPKLEKDKPKVDAPDTDIKVNKVQVHLESRKLPIKEGVDIDINEVLCEYDVNYVFDEFLNGNRKKQTWGPLINPMQYQKALSEFTQYGRLIRFPSDIVYRWMGIIMKNTAILEANTIIAGHESLGVDTDDAEYFANRFYGRTDIEAVGNYGCEFLLIPVTNEEVIEMCNDKGIHVEANGDIQTYIDKFNAENNGHFDNKLEMSSNGDGIFLRKYFYEMLEETGIIDWMQMPDGSDAWTDFGLKPLYKILSEFNEETTPDECLVLVNRALDVYHQRGDMASIFIEGGSKSLTSISEEIKKCKGKEIIISEKQLLSLKKII